MILEALVALAAAAPAPGCQTAECTMRVTERPHHRLLSRIAACETRGMSERARWRASTGNGYFGGLQFSLQSWNAVGGHGRPDHAPELEQRYRAVRLLQRQGIRAWPVCGPPALRGLP